MTYWVLYATFGHVLNAIAFIIDKTLLRTTFKQSATYAILISLLTSVVLLATPFVESWPSGNILWPVALFGAIQVAALWAFFESLKRGEASRVVPIVGVLVAVFTFFGTSIALGERFTSEQYGGFILLVISTGILAWGGDTKKGRISLRVLCLAVISAALFAIASVSGKYAFDHATFSGVFVASRFYMVLGGAALFLLDAPARQELLSLFMPKKRKENGIGGRAIGLTAVAQTAGAGGFILVNYAIALGSAALVNAMQAVQYGLIVIVAWLGGKWMRELLNEQKTPVIVTLKSFAILLVAIGLYLISHNSYGL